MKTRKIETILTHIFVLIVFLVLNWIIDLISYIQPNYPICNGIFCITTPYRFLVYHILWYGIIVIGVIYIIYAIVRELENE